MKLKADRFSVFLQLVAHRERWRRRASALVFFGRDLRSIMSDRKVSGAAAFDVPMRSHERAGATES